MGLQRKVLGLQMPEQCEIFVLSRAKGLYYKNHADPIDRVTGELEGNNLSVSITVYIVPNKK